MAGVGRWRRMLTTLSGSAYVPIEGDSRKKRAQSDMADESEASKRPLDMLRARIETRAVFDLVGGLERGALVCASQSVGLNGKGTSLPRFAYP